MVPNDLSADVFEEQRYELIQIHDWFELKINCRSLFGQIPFPFIHPTFDLIISCTTIIMAQRMLELSISYEVQKNQSDWYLKQMLLDDFPLIGDGKMQEIYADLCFFKVKQESLNELCKDTEQCQETVLDEDYGEEDRNNQVIKRNDILAEAMKVLGDPEDMKESRKVFHLLNCLFISYIIIINLTNRITLKI
jgi:hypothetical protein